MSSLSEDEADWDGASVVVPEVAGAAAGAVHAVTMTAASTVWSESHGRLLG